eukprot:11627894-Karenia_brevis.AAC.1
MLADGFTKRLTQSRGIAAGISTRPVDSGEGVEVYRQGSEHLQCSHGKRRRRTPASEEKKASKRGEREA